MALSEKKLHFMNYSNRVNECLLDSCQTYAVFHMTKVTKTYIYMFNKTS